jgi:hypothetical protein
VGAAPAKAIEVIFRRLDMTSSIADYELGGDGFVMVIPLPVFSG